MMQHDLVPLLRITGASEERRGKEGWQRAIDLSTSGKTPTRYQSLPCLWTLMYNDAMPISSAQRIMWVGYLPEPMMSPQMSSTKASTSSSTRTVWALGVVPLNTARQSGARETQGK
jgi:hypothetical protein